MFFFLCLIGLPCALTFWSTGGEGSRFLLPLDGFELVLAGWGEFSLDTLFSFCFLLEVDGFSSSASFFLRPRVPVLFNYFFPPVSFCLRSVSVFPPFPLATWQKSSNASFFLCRNWKDSSCVCNCCCGSFSPSGKATSMAVSRAFFSWLVSSSPFDSSSSLYLLELKEENWIIEPSFHYIL